jgi:hypothetical protein
VTTSRALAAIGLAIAVTAPCAGATVTGYTTRAAFDAAIAGLSTTASVDFDDLADGTVIANGSSVGGVAFTQSIGGGVEFVVTGRFTTTSDPNCLGTSTEDVFLAGDAFTMGLPASTAIGLYVIGEDLLPGDFALATVGGDVESGDAETTLTDGSLVFFLGLVESDPELAVTSATLTSFFVEGLGDFVWNVDDVVAAPEPGALAAAVAALAALSRRAAWRRKTTRARSASHPGR